MREVDARNLSEAGSEPLQICEVAIAGTGGLKRDDITMPERFRPTEPELDLPEDESLGANERIDLQVQKAQEQLQSLKRQQDQIEKQKRELEELHRRQEEFEHGKAEMVEKLTRALVMLEKQAHDSQRRTEQLRMTHETFGSHLKSLELINPNTWSQTELGKELTRALSSLDNARADYSHSRARLNNDLPEDVEAEIAAEEGYDDGVVQHDFVYWLKSGFAFTLPIFLIGLAILAWLMLRFPLGVTR